MKLVRKGVDSGWKSFAAKLAGVEIGREEEEIQNFRYKR